MDDALELCGNPKSESNNKLDNCLSRAYSKVDDQVHARAFCFGSGKAMAAGVPCRSRNAFRDWASVLRTRKATSVPAGGRPRVTPMSAVPLSTTSPSATGVQGPPRTIWSGSPFPRLSSMSPGYGKERPVCQEPDEACWQRNRRIHIVAMAQPQ